MEKIKWAQAAWHAAAQRTATVNLVVTRRCDLACSYCHATGKTPEITVDEWLSIARKLAPRFAVFTVSGGEPLLFRGLPELINGLSQIGLAGLCSNVRRIDAATLEAMPGLDYLNFSIDQLDAAEVSRKTAFGKIPLLVEHARRQKFALYGTAVITSRNADVIPELVREMHRYGVPLHLQLVQRPAPENAFDTPAKLVRLAELQAELLAMRRAGYAIEESVAYLSGFGHFVQGEAAVDCQAGRTYLAVDTDGRLMACQDSPPSGPPLHRVDDAEPLLAALPASRAADCRCWWNCYHRYAEWERSPWRLIAAEQFRHLRRRWRQPKPA